MSSSQLYTQAASPPSQAQSHKRIASSYVSAENGGPSGASASGSGSASTSTSGYGLGFTQRSPSPSPTRTTFNHDELYPNGSTNGDRGPLSVSMSLARSTSEHHLPSPGAGGGRAGQLDPTANRQSYRCALHARGAAGQPPIPLRLFQVSHPPPSPPPEQRDKSRTKLTTACFPSCTLVFFSALAGIGYHEPPPDQLADLSISPQHQSAPAAGAFKFGGPVFDLTDAQARERRMAEQRALEESWAKKRRPKDVSAVSH